MVENHCRRMPDDPLRGSNHQILGIIDKPPLLGHTMLRVLIIGNAPTKNLSQWSHLIKDSDIIIACDGALETCRNSGISVDIVIGDMDSITNEALDYAKSAGVKIVKLADQNSNDLSKAINHANSLAATDITIVNVDGGSSDHQFANYLSLIEAESTARLMLNDCIVTAVSNNKPLKYSIETGTEFSLFSLGVCTGVELNGGKWQLENAELKPSSMGLHNIAIADKLSISCASGHLLLFVSS